MREREVITLVGQGRAVKEVARDLGIAIRTVEHHLELVREKLSATSTVHAAALYFAENPHIARQASWRKV